MRTYDGGYFAIEIPSHRLLFGSCLGMKINKDHLYLWSQRCQQILASSERTIDCRHEYAPLKIEYGKWNSVSGLSVQQSCAWSARRIIGESQETRFLIKVRKNLFLVKDVIP